MAGDLVQDLEVRVLRTTLVHPQEKRERRAMFLSNIDQVLDFDVERIQFFAAHGEYPPCVVAEKLEAALARLLSTYDFLAGRLRLDDWEGRLVIDCNAAGVVFVVAESELRMEEIGDLACQNPAFMQLMAEKPASLKLEDKPLFALKITSFKCGGFAIVTSQNHTTLDGASFKTFYENLASLVSGKPLAVVPFTDRRLLAARSPPCVQFSHPELVDLKDLQHEQQQEEHLNQSLLTTKLDDLELRLLRLSSDDIQTLKDNARTDGGKAGGGPWITSFNVVTAHLWRCKALSAATAENINPDKISTILYAVDLRPRLQPPLPRSYAGNAVLTAYGAATHRELSTLPLGRIVKLLYEGVTRMSDEYARSVIDWGELHKGFPRGDAFVSSWWKLGLMEVEFPWGRPKYSGPLMQPDKDIILLAPDTESEGKGAGGVNVIVALPSNEFFKFETLFYKFLLN